MFIGHNVNDVGLLTPLVHRMYKSLRGICSLFFVRWPLSHGTSKWFIVCEGWYHMFSGPNLILDDLIRALYCDVSDLVSIM